MVKAAQIAKGPCDDESKPSKPAKPVAKTTPAKPVAKTTPITPGVVTATDPVWERIGPHLPECARDDRTARRAGFLAGFYGEKALSTLIKRILS